MATQTTAHDIRHHDGEPPITMLTAYDAPTATRVDAADIDIILVGDSMGTAVLGYETTLPVTLEEVASRTSAVARATEEALVVADMPFLSVGLDRTESLRNCGRMLKEADAGGVKIESGSHTVDLTADLVELGIPVMAHVGLTPQRVREVGGYTQQGDDPAVAEEIRELAVAHEEAGAFAVVLEHVPPAVAQAVTEEVSIPTIGIGAGPACDGQVLVFNDVIGLGEWSPPFAKQFGDVGSAVTEAVEAYAEAVRTGTFPTDDHV